jgi:hypothetical protein
MHVAQQKSRPKAALNSNLMILDHAAINAGFAFAHFVRRACPPWVNRAGLPARRSLPV